jgi:hypothetical protein
MPPPRVDHRALQSAGAANGAARKQTPRRCVKESKRVPSAISPKTRPRLPASAAAASPSLGGMRASSAQLTSASAASSLLARAYHWQPGRAGRVQGCQLRQRTRPWGSQFGSSQVAVRLTRRCHPRARRAASAVGLGVFQPAPLPRTRPVVAEASLKSSPTKRAGQVPRRPLIVTAARGGGGAAPPPVAKK